MGTLKSEEESKLNDTQRTLQNQGSPYEKTIQVAYTYPTSPASKAMIENTIESKIQKNPETSKLTLKEDNLRDKLADGGAVEIGGIAGVPTAIPFVEIKFHKMAGD